MSKSKAISHVASERLTPIPEHLLPQPESVEAVQFHNALQILTIKHIDFRFKQARALFAAVADRHYKQMPYQRLFDAPAVWAGVCSGRYDPAVFPPEAMSYIGKAEVDCIVSEGGEEAAERLCKTIFETVNADIAAQLQLIANKARARRAEADTPA